jgi:hypothetical protein
MASDILMSMGSTTIAILNGPSRRSATLSTASVIENGIIEEVYDGRNIRTLGKDKKKILRFQQA